MLTVAVSCEVMIKFAATGKRDNFTVTLGDFAVKLMDF
jgi:hypothetical protein